MQHSPNGGFYTVSCCDSSKQNNFITCGMGKLTALHKCLSVNATYLKDTFKN